MASINLQVVVLATQRTADPADPDSSAQLSAQSLREAVSHAEQLPGAAVSVILGEDAADFAPFFSRSAASMYIDANWRDGLYSAVRKAIAVMPPACTALLFLSAHRQYVKAAELAQLMHAHAAQPEYVAIAPIARTTGVPVIFPSWTFSELAQVRGERPLQQLIERYRDRVVSLASL